MKTSRLALVVLTSGLLCLGSCIGEDEKKAESDAAIAAFEATFAKAKAGNTDAMNSLSGMYAYGYGVIQDDKEAVKWCRKAADLGNTDAMGSLGGMYFTGIGAIQDVKEAVKWWRKAADLGNTDAMNSLGGMYFMGTGVIQDDVEAYAWTNVAAANGNKDAAGECEIFKTIMTSKQIAEGQKRSREIMESIAKG